MSAAFSTSTEVGMLDARTSLGSVTLPLTTDIPSRMITLKDVFGTAANSTITIKTQGSDLFEDGTTSKTMAANYDFMTLHAGSTNRWYIHATSLPPTMTMGSTITRFLSASNATISSINGAVPLLPANIASTIAGLGTAGFISTASLTSSLQSLSTIAANAFTGSTTSLSAATIFVSSLAANSLTTSTLQVYNSINLTGGVMSNVASNFFTTPKFTTTFTPTSISGLKVWLDASVTTSITSNGSGQVLSLSNLTGLGNATQATPSSAPLTGQYTFNNLNVLSNSFNTQLVLPSINYTSQYRTAFLVLQAPYYSAWIGANRSTDSIGMWSYGDLEIATAASWIALTSFPSDAQNIPIIIDIHSSAASNGVYMNGSNLGSLLRTFATGSFTDTIGLGGTATPLGGYYGASWYFGEFIYYDAELTVSQRQTVEGYLAWKWGTQGLLAATHPSYSAPPPPLGIVYLPAGSVGTDVSSNLMIQATVTTKISLAGNAQATGAFAASTLSTSFLTSAQINVSSISTNTLTSQTLSTLAFNVSSINGTVYSVFVGSTTFLSAATTSVSSLTTNVLTVSTALVRWNGTVAPTSYGLGVDTLTLQTTNAGYAGGIASMAFATATASYPLARIYAVDSAASGPAVSQLVFQTVPTSATSFSSNFTYTGATTTLTIPTGVTSVNVQMWGAGGGGYQGVGGAGAFVQGTLAVTPNQVLTILVGSGGSSNTTIFGGGGGVGANFASVGGGGRAAIQLNFSLQPVPITITGLSGSGSSAAVTTSGVHGLSIGQPVTISGASPYNGIYVIIAVTSNTFTIPTTTTGTVTLSSPNIIAEVAIAGGGGSGGYQSSGIGGFATFSGTSSSGLPFGGGGGGQYNSSTPLQGGSNGGGSPSGFASPLQGTGGVNYAGQGGGGYYGGGGGGGSPTAGNVYSGGGGGSSYTSLLTSVTGSNSVDGITPPATSVPGYVTGVAKGGAANGAPNPASWGGNAQIIIGTVGNSYAEAMRIGTTGNVGIGTAAPATLLDVAGTSRSQAMSTLSFNASTINGIPLGAQAVGVQTLAF